IASALPNLTDIGLLGPIYYPDSVLNHLKCYKQLPRLKTIRFPDLMFLGLGYDPPWCGNAYISNPGLRDELHSQAKKLTRRLLKELEHVLAKDGPRPQRVIIGDLICEQDANGRLQRDRNVYYYGRGECTEEDVSHDEDEDEDEEGKEKRGKDQDTNAYTNQILASSSRMSSYDYLEQPVSIDSSESEDDDKWYKRVARPTPFMKLFSKEKRDLRHHERILLWEARRAGISEEEVSCKAWRMFAHKRFFYTIIGFHLGELDLTGRHQPRYHALEARFNRLSLELGALLHIFEAEHPSFSLKKENPWDLLGEDPLWMIFIERWKLYDATEAKEFAGEYDRTLKIIRASAGPIFQRLLLQQLPVELLREIYGYIDEDGARALASTCKHLRSIGEQFIFKCLTLVLSIPPDWYESMKQQRQKAKISKKEYLQDVALSARTRYLNDASRILSRPQIVASTQNLGPRFPDFDPSARDPSFYTPIYDTTYDILAMSQNLTTLELRGFQVTGRLMQLLRTQSYIHTLKCHNSWVDSDIADPIEDTEGQPANNFVVKTIRTLGLYLRDGYSNEAYEPWHLIASFPQLRNLFMESDPESSTELPDRYFSSSSPIFSTLEQFSIMQIMSSDIPDLLTWMLATPEHTTQDSILVLSSVMTNLTHFKLRTSDLMPLDTIRSIVETLRHAPNLKFLALEMISWGVATPELVQIISHTLSHLSGLTLTAFTTPEACSPACRWPLPMWEYTKPFTSFKNLEYFGWNYCWEIAYAPIEMPFIEDGYPEGEDWIDASERINQGIFIAAYPDAAAFLAYCPSLKTMAFLGKNDSWARVCMVNEEGGIMRMEDRFDVESQPQWNPWMNLWSDVATRQGQ
ncbi:hypothetical protein FRC17_010430, partial [Serendipita sp. 399]